MTNKRRIWWIAGIIVVTLVILLIILRGNEDSWIKDSRGVWVEHGAPAETPDYVTVQQEAISCANELYNKAIYINVTLESQCLGKCGNYSIDMVNVPRTSEDNLAENQCEDYANKITTRFIELDKNGDVVRIG